MAAYNNVSLPRESNEKIHQFSYEQALEYAASSAEASEEIDRFAQSVLDLLSDHTYVAMHGDAWKKRFNIDEGSSALDAVHRIGDVLEKTLKAPYLPDDAVNLPSCGISFDSIQTVFELEQSDRRNLFQRILMFRMLQLKDPNIKYQADQILLTASEYPGDALIEALSQISQSKEWNQTLFNISAQANYWEALPILLQRIPMPSTQQIENLQKKFEIGVEWIRVFNNITHGIYNQLAQYTCQEAREWMEMHPSEKEIGRQYARDFLAALRLHPYVAVHGDRWRKAFRLFHSMHSLDAIEKIFSKLQEELQAKHVNDIDYVPPRLSLNLESFDEAFKKIESI